MASKNKIKIFFPYILGKKRVEVPCHEKTRTAPSSSMSGFQGAVLLYCRMSLTLVLQVLWFFAHFFFLVFQRTPCVDDVQQYEWNQYGNECHCFQRE